MFRSAANLKNHRTYTAFAFGVTRQLLPSCTQVECSICACFQSPRRNFCIAYFERFRQLNWHLAYAGIAVSISWFLCASFIPLPNFSTGRGMVHFACNINLANFNSCGRDPSPVGSRIANDRAELARQEFCSSIFDVDSFGCCALAARRFASSWSCSPRFLPIKFPLMTCLNTWTFLYRHNFKFAHLVNSLPSFLGITNRHKDHTWYNCLLLVLLGAMNQEANMFF